LYKLEGIKDLAGVAKETLNAIKVVSSFGQEQSEIEKFTLKAEVTKDIAK
jgi:ABC-type multidrug transport system fused ATPase/permease subunit